MRPASTLYPAVSLIALIFLTLYWELFGAPLRPEGSWLVLKTLPLLLPLMGVLRGQRQTYRWALMLVLPYFIEGATRAWADPAPSAYYALAQSALVFAFFVTAIAYIRSPVSAGKSTESA